MVVNSSPGSEAGARGRVPWSPASPGVVQVSWRRPECPRAEMSPSSLRPKVSVVLEHTRSHLPCSLHALWPPS